LRPSTIWQKQNFYFKWLISQLSNFRSARVLSTLTFEQKVVLTGVSPNQSLKLVQLK